MTHVLDCQSDAIIISNLPTLAIKIDKDETPRDEQETSPDLLFSNSKSISLFGLDLSESDLDRQS